MKITFLLPVVSQARYHKRVTALERLGIQPNILAFERDYYPGKPWQDGFQPLGNIQHRHYSKRFLPFVKALPLVRAAAKETDAIYAFGLDTLLLGWLASRDLDKRLKIIYEIGDIREVLLGSRLLSWSLRWLERYLLRRVDLLVATSRAFITEYYQGIQGLTDLRYQVIENKIDANSLPQLQKPMICNEWNGTLRIGYFGLIRCPRSWEILTRAVERGEGRVRLYVRGVFVGMEDSKDKILRMAYIDYDGPYVVPDDLPAIYGQVDMVWACYPYQGSGIGNWRWARTSRFYQACFFRRPMFVQAGTEDGRVVEGLGLGICLDLADVEETVDLILRVGEAELDRWQQNIARLPKDVYAYSDEHEQLVEAIQ